MERGYLENMPMPPLRACRDADDAAPCNDGRYLLGKCLEDAAFVVERECV
jgi:hypothetical protein